MLTRLAIRNLALIEEVDLTLQSGFTVLTGETGAGKSLLLDALGLALGARADAGLIRAGQTVCDITAEFTCPPTPELTAICEEQGLELETPLTLRRQLKREGDKATAKAWVNGTPVNATVLARLAEELLDIHGQHATHQLFKATHQRDMLDELGGLLREREAVAQAHSTWQSLHRQWQQAQTELTRLESSAETTATWLEELNTLAYAEGEEIALTENRTKASGMQSLSQSLQLAEDALEGHSGALAALRSAGKALMAASKTEESLAPIADRLYDLLSQLEDTAHSLARQTGTMTGEEFDIEKIDDRLHALRAAARKHRVDVPQLTEVQEKLAHEAGSHASLSAQTAKLEKETATAARNLAEVSTALNDARTKAFTPLEHHLTEALRALHLPHAKLVIQRTPLGQPGAAGEEQVELLFTANPGTPPQGLGKVASGGELSRAMLALKSVLFQALSPRTMVLDEVDSGLSGPTAAAIGQAIARLAQRHQVLAITHHPQVAAAAARHLFISKSHMSEDSAKTPQATTTTSVVQLSETARQEELARLLAGSEITPEARAAAAALLRENSHLRLVHAA